MLLAKWKENIITDDGHRLIAKAQSGIKIRFTKVVSGDGDYAEVFDLRSARGILSQKQVAEIKDVTVVGTNTVNIKAILSNKSLTTGYFIKEIGLMAVAEDEPTKEVLYCIAITENGKWDFWPQFEGAEVRMPISISVATGNSSMAIVEVFNTYKAFEIGYENSKSGLEATNLQVALDEVVNKHDLDIVIHHNLDTYPDVLAIVADYGYGMGGYGQTPYGGTNGKKLESNVVYLDANSIKVAVSKKFNPIKNIEKISLKEYIVTFVDSTLSLLLILLTNSVVVGNQNQVGVNSFNGRIGEVVILESDIPQTIVRKNEMETSMNQLQVTIEKQLTDDGEL